MAQRKSAAEILAHPRFAEARRSHVDAFVARFRGGRFATRLMRDAATILVCGFLVGFHAAYDPDDRNTWATPGRVRKHLAEHRLASARHVDDILSRLGREGYLETQPCPADRRMRILSPSERLIAHDREHLVAYHLFLHTLYPERGYEWTEDPDPHVHLAIRAASIHARPRTPAFLRHAPFTLFLAHDAGYLAFLLAAQAQLAERALSFATMSETLGVSRSHLRNLFVEAEAAGFVRLQPYGRRAAEILPVLWTAYDHFLADVEARQDGIAQAAFAGLAAQSRIPSAGA